MNRPLTNGPLCAGRWSGALLLAVAAACNETPVELPRAAQLVLSTTQLDLGVGDSEQLEAAVLEQNGAELRDATVVWSSDNDRVAAIDGVTGLVTAVNTGTATITATHGALAATVTVNILGVASVEIIPAAVQLIATGPSQTVSAVVRGAQGEQVFPTVFWHSTDFTIAAIPVTGGAVAGVNVGVSNLVAEVSDVADTIPVTVVPDSRFLIGTVAIAADTVVVDVAAGPTTIGYSALNNIGDETCGSQTATRAIGLRFDTSILTTAVFSAGCVITITPRAGTAGGNWLFVESNTAVDSVWVDVINPVFTAAFTGLPDLSIDSLNAGDTATYIVTATDKTGAPVQGVSVQFTVTGGNVVGSSEVPTDAIGQAVVAWSVPTAAAATGSAHSISFSAEFPGGTTVGPTSVAQTVFPGRAASVVMIFDAESPKELPARFASDSLRDGDSVTTLLGVFPSVAAQSFDQFGNQRVSRVLFETDNPAFVSGDVADGNARKTEVRPLRTGRHRLSATDGSATATIAIGAVVEPEAAVVTRFNDVTTGQAFEVEDPTLTDTTVYDGASGLPDFATFTLRDDTVAFAFRTGVAPVRWNVALAPSDGTNASGSPNTVLGSVNEATDVWGFPVFRTLAGNPAGGLVFLSDCDAVKAAATPCAAGVHPWDVYALNRATGVVTAITNHTDAAVTYRGLSLSPDQRTVLLVQTNTVFNVDGTVRSFSEVLEIDITPTGGGATAPITANQDTGTEYRSADYSPDGSDIFVEAVVNGSSQLFMSDRTSFQLLLDLANPSAHPTFDPGNPNIVVIDNGGTVQLIDLSFPTVVTAQGRTAINRISWSRR